VQLLDEVVLDRAREIASTRGVARAVLIDGDRTLDWKHLDDASRRAAISLQRAGVCRGDRVAVVAPNAIESVVAYLAVLRVGAVLVPIPADTRMPRLRAILSDCDPQAVVAPRVMLVSLRASIAEESDGLDARWVEFALDDNFARPMGVPLEFGQGVSTSKITAREVGCIDADLAVIMYTSGTTGEPKGVMLTHANLLNTTAAVAEYLGEASASGVDVVSLAIPLTYSYGFLQLWTALRSGATVVLEGSFAFPFDAMRRMEQHRVSVLIAVPTMISRILATLPHVALELSQLRAMTCAAASLSPTQAVRCTELLPHVALHLMYGQTECSRAATLDPRLVRTHPDSVGSAIPNCELFLIDTQGRQLPAGSEGELVVRGANVARGYWRRPEETALKFIASPLPDASPSERVLRTGDRFRIHRNGLLTFIGREDEIFKCRGEKVAPMAVERVLASLDGVVDAAVTGVPHEEDGMAIHAVVVLEADATVDERAIRARCREFLEPALQPRFVEFRREIPRTANGKLIRRALVGAGA
jgi:amino acid adenylation domain-containing protein